MKKETVMKVKQAARKASEWILILFLALPSSDPVRVKISTAAAALCHGLVRLFGDLFTLLGTTLWVPGKGKCLCPAFASHNLLYLVWLLWSCWCLLCGLFCAFIFAQSVLVIVKRCFHHTDPFNLTWTSLSKLWTDNWQIGLFLYLFPERDLNASRLRAITSVEHEKVSVAHLLMRFLVRVLGVPQLMRLMDEQMQEKSLEVEEENDAAENQDKDLLLPLVLLLPLLDKNEGEHKYELTLQEELSAKPKEPLADSEEDEEGFEKVVDNLDTVDIDLPEEATLDSQPIIMAGPKNKDLISKINSNESTGKVSQTPEDVQAQDQIVEEEADAKSWESAKDDQEPKQEIQGNNRPRRLEVDFESLLWEVKNLLRKHSYTAQVM